MEYFELARKYVEERYGADADEQTKDVLTRWEDTLNRLENDPMSLSGELDWIAKRELLEGYRRRDSLDWDAARLHLVDLQYADVRPEKGLYNRLAARGRMKRLLDEDDVEQGPYEASGGHQGLLPGPLPGAVRGRRGRRLLGLGHLRPAGPRLAAAGAHPGAAAGHHVTTSRSSWTAAVRRRSWSGCCPAAERAPVRESSAMAPDVETSTGPDVGPRCRV